MYHCITGSNGDECKKYIYILVSARPVSGIVALSFIFDAVIKAICNLRDGFFLLSSCD